MKEEKIFLKGCCFGTALFLYGVSLRALLIAEKQAPEPIELLFGLFAVMIVLVLASIAAYAVFNEKTPAIVGLPLMTLLLGYLGLKCTGTSWLLGISADTIHPLAVLPVAFLAALILVGAVALCYRFYLVARNRDESIERKTREDSGYALRVSTASWLAIGFYLALMCWILCVI